MRHSSPLKECVSLLDKGYSLVPLVPNTKKAFFNDWVNLCNAKLNPTQKKVITNMADKDNYNVGLQLGSASGLIGIDLDYDVDNLHAKIKQIIGTSPLVKTGQKGETLFFRYSGEKSMSITRNGVTVMDLLSDGRQTVLPPSIHPCGVPYKWIGTGTLESVDPFDIPALPKDAIKRIAMLKNDRLDDINLDEVIDALNFISSEDYDDWIKIGIILKYSLGEDGFDIWKNWSAKSPKFKDTGLEHRWKGFKPNGKLSIGTLFFTAANNGYVIKNKSMKLDDVINPLDIKDELEEWRVNGRDRGTTAGMGRLDDLLAFRPNEYTVITGYANTGKSEFVDSLTMNLAKKGWNILYASIEKNPKSHIQTLIHKYTGKPITERTKEDQDRALEFISNHFKFLGANFDCSCSSLKSITTVCKKNFGIDLLVVDPYNYLVSGQEPNSYGHALEVNTLLSRLAKELNIHIILVAHPKVPETRKDGELPKVNMYSISGGANFANVADNMLAVSRSGEYTDVNVMKVRDQDLGNVGVVKFKYNPKTKEHEVYG